jgi:TonB family protein
VATRGSAGGGAAGPTGAAPATAGQEGGGAASDGSATRDGTAELGDTDGADAAEASERPPASRQATVEPVAAIRRALHLDARGLSSGSGRASTSVDGGAAVHASTLEAEASAVTSASARGTPLGVYLAQVEALVIGRWAAVDPPIEALLAVRPVVVSFRLHRTGEVTDLTLVQSSGEPAVDALAVSAIPDRVPRFPRDVEPDVVAQKVTLIVRLPDDAPPAHPER